MEIDAPLMHDMQEHFASDNDNGSNHRNTNHISSSTAFQSGSSMNFDYLQGLRADAAASASTSSAIPNAIGLVDDSKALDRPCNLNERIVSIVDQLDAHVEKFRKEALNLQEQKDYLLMSVDLIKNNEMLQTMTQGEREEIMLYIQRVSSRLGTVELNVRTVRDKSQEDSLSQINAFIDTMIKMGDPVMSRQRCQLYLNATVDPSGHLGTVHEADVGPIDKKFESALLGCTLDDQKNIKRRLQALLGYLNKQTVTNK